MTLTIRIAVRRAPVTGPEAREPEREGVASGASETSGSIASGEPRAVSDRARATLSLATGA